MQPTIRRCRLQAKQTLANEPAVLSDVGGENAVGMRKPDPVDDGNAPPLDSGQSHWTTADRATSPRQ